MTNQPRSYAILVVEDESLLRDLLLHELQRKGFATFGAENIKCAFELIEQKPIDIVLSDLRMAGGSGVELLEKISSMPQPRPRVIMMSGSPGIVENEIFRRGAAAFISKPFRAKDLITLIEQQLTLSGFQQVS